MHTVSYNQNHRMLELKRTSEIKTQNLWDAAKAVLRGKFIEIQSYLKKQEKKFKIGRAHV